MPDDAGKWLRENDPDYDERMDSEYPYFSRWQWARRSRREIPVSSLYALRQRLGLTEDDVVAIKERMGWSLLDGR